MRALRLTTYFLMMVGALNWLGVGAARFDLVRRLFGRNSLITRLVYNLVGVAGVVQAVTFALRARRGMPEPAAG